MRTRFQGQRNNCIFISSIYSTFLPPLVLSAVYMACGMAVSFCWLSPWLCRCDSFLYMYTYKNKSQCVYTCTIILVYRFGIIWMHSFSALFKILYPKVAWKKSQYCNKAVCCTLPCYVTLTLLYCVVTFIFIREKINTYTTSRSTKYTNGTNIKQITVVLCFLLIFFNM